MNEEVHKNKKEKSLKSTEDSEEQFKNKKKGINHENKENLEDPQNYSKLKTELFDNQSFNETFLPLNPKTLNLDYYTTNPTINKYRNIRKKERAENKENTDPNF